MKMTERECNLLALKHQDTPWVPSPSTGQDFCVPVVIEEGARGYGITSDWFGVKYIYEKGQPGPMPLESEHKIVDIEDWRDVVKFPDLDKYDWEKGAIRDTATWDRKNKLSSCVLINGMFESLHAFCGFEDALCNLLLDEEACTDFISAFADYKIGLIERIAKYYKADKIIFHDDYANNDSIFMQKSIWRRIIRPHLKRVVDAVHGCNMLYEHHSCGKVRDLIPDLIELGIDALNPVQIQNNPVELKKMYKDKLCLCGGFDNQGILDRVDVTEQEIKDSMRKTLEEMSPGGKWMAFCTFIDPKRNQFWLDVLDEWNRPLYEQMGMKPAVHHADEVFVMNLAENSKKRDQQAT